MRFRKLGRGLLALAVGTTLAACDEFLSVDNPTVVEADAIDPVADATVLSRSAQQNLATSYGWLIMYSAWFTGEAYVIETFPTRNEFARRDVQVTNTSHNADVWAPLSQARALADRYLALAGDAASSLNVARAAMVSGFAMQFMAEQFCVGTISTPDNEPGPPLNTQQMLDIAVQRFTRAIDVGRTLTGAEASNIVNSSLVGRARAHLQAGRAAQALADANQVPAGFSYSLPYVDDVGNRTRLSNRLWQFTVDRGSIGVAPAFRVADPRVPFLPPGQHPYNAFDAADQSEFFAQQKYPSYAAPIRLASKMEADYIAAEAQGTAAMLTLIQARRAANNQGAYTGPTDPQSVLVEFFEQRGREFFLENKRLGDFRRHPTAVRHMPVPGTPYRKGGEPIRDQQCYPLPLQETDNNPNF
jgi:hypothetical protein